MDRIEITTKIRKELHRLKDQTGLGAMALLRGRKDIPKGFSSGRVTGWLNGNTRTANAEHINYMLDVWRAAEPLVRLTDAVRAEMKTEMERTGHKPASLLGCLRPQPSTLDASMLSRWLTGKTQAVRAPLFNFVMDGLQKLPDRPAGTKMPYYRQSPEQPRRIFSEADQASLVAERERTGIPATRLILESTTDDAPAGLTESAINSWINRNPNTVPTEYFKWVLETWKSLPDKPKPRPKRSSTDHCQIRYADVQRRFYTESDRDALLFERERTGVFEGSLLNDHFPDTAPKNLYPSTINGWINKVLRTVPTDLYDWTLKAWRSIPNAPK